MNIQLPGYTDDPSIEVISARYLPDATYKYYAQLLISHPGYQSRELIDLFELEFIGMDISQMAIQLGQATLDITETDNEQTCYYRLSIDNTKKIKDELCKLKAPKSKKIKDITPKKD